MFNGAQLKAQTSLHLDKYEEKKIPFVMKFHST